jgi:hypothetical protein
MSFFLDGKKRNIEETGGEEAALYLASKYISIFYLGAWIEIGTLSTPPVMLRAEAEKGRHTAPMPVPVVVKKHAVEEQKKLGRSDSWEAACE